LSRLAVASVDERHSSRSEDSIASSCGLNTDRKCDGNREVVGREDVKYQNVSLVVWYLYSPISSTCTCTVSQYLAVTENGLGTGR
jgi:hypothetical protein